MRGWLWAFCLVGMVCLAACNGGKKPVDKSAAENGSAATDSDKGVANGGLPLRTGVETWPGRWALVMVQATPDQRNQVQFRDMCLVLLDLRQDGTTYTGEVLATIDKRIELKIDRVEIQGPQIKLDFSGSLGTMNFEGQLADGIARGSVKTSDGMQAATLKPTTELKFGEWDPAPVAAGMEQFAQASQEKNQLAALAAAGRELRGNPLALDAFQFVLQRLPQATTVTEEKVRDLVKDYRDSAALWGERMEMQAAMNSAAGVAMTRRLPKLAMELVTDLEQRSPELKQGWESQLKLIREQAEIDIALQKIRSSDEAAQTEAFTALKALLPGQRYNAEILHALGEHTLKLGEKGAAQEYFADIVAVPLLEGVWMKSREGQPPGDPTPRERLLKLWEEANGSTENIEEYLNDVYHRRIEEILSQAQSASAEPVPTDAGNHTVLVELFTGTFCPPCVAGDLSTTVLQRIYPHDKVAVLQFHQHIPGPDPLSNQDSEDRLSYYQVNQTPWALIDGIETPPPGIGGYVQHVGQALDVIRRVVDPRLKITTEVKLTATAHGENGELHVDVSVDGIAEDVLPNTKLRLALAEDVVNMLAPNGVRQHHMVVREMLGGAKGTGPRSGKLAYTLQLPLAELKQHQVDYLRQFEAGRDLKFPEKPLEFKPLTLVAWVQNETTREVLQTIAVPVTGELRYPEHKPSDGAASAESPANAQ